MQAIGYVRVSTEAQAAEGVSLAAQRARIRAWAKSRGVDLVAIHADEAVPPENLIREIRWRQRRQSARPGARYSRCRAANGAAKSGSRWFALRCALCYRAAADRILVELTITGSSGRAPVAVVKATENRRADDRPSVWRLDLARHR